MLFLRPNEFHTAQRADYSVFDRTLDGERKVGRIYSGVGSLGDKWMWTISGWGSAQAENLEDAKQKLCRQYELLGNKPPWPP